MAKPINLQQFSSPQRSSMIKLAHIQQGSLNALTRPPACMEVQSGTRKLDIRLSAFEHSAASPFHANQTDLHSCTTRGSVKLQRLRLLLKLSSI